MRTSPRISLALLLGLSCLASPAFAGFGGWGGGGAGQRMITIGIGGGVAVPVNDAKDAFKNGFNGLAYARLRPPGLPISFGVNVAFQRFDLKQPPTVSAGLPPPNVDGNSQLLAGIGEIKLDLTHARIHPYLTAGLGAYNVKTDVSGSTTGTDSKTHFGVNGGAGIAARLGRLSAYIQGRVDNVYQSDKGVIDAKSIQVVPVTAGIEF